MTDSQIQIDHRLTRSLGIVARRTAVLPTATAPTAQHEVAFKVPGVHAIEALPLHCQVDPVHRGDTEWQMIFRS